MQSVSSENFYKLPSGYNENRITLMARDPHWLFAYWEVSNDSKKAFCENFGEELWDKSIPVLKILNISKNESFFVRINDFSNNWYINVADSNCLYSAEIGRKLSEDFFINLASSNLASAPSDTVSPDTNTYFIDYRKLKKGVLNLHNNKIYEQIDYSIEADFISGLSSPELFGIDIKDSIFGISSAELFGFNILEQIGISS